MTEVTSEFDLPEDLLYVKLDEKTKVKYVHYTCDTFLIAGLSNWWSRIPSDVQILIDATYSSSYGI